MCGIAGILRVSGGVAGGGPESARAARARAPHDAIPEAWLDALDESIKHRGPDGRGRFRDRAVRPDGTVVDVALVHRRLSIIDYEGGRQPMVSPAKGSGVVQSGRLLVGSGLGLYESSADELAGNHVADATIGSPRSDLVAVAFNGCIYNHRALRAELRALGHTFSSDHSDTEVMVHGWREWALGLFPRLEGMFAAMIWDSGQGTLALARDRFGEKPLFTMHSHHGGSWINAFGSVPPEATPLRSMIGPNDRPFEPPHDIRRWLRFGFAGGPPLPRSDAVGPGTFTVYGPTSRGRWSGVTADTQEGVAAEAYASQAPGQPRAWPDRDRPLSPPQTDALLRTAVSQRLEADVPVGCFLSGGVDSSLIARFARDAVGSLDTFTVRMPSAEYDESAFGEAVARIVGSRHHTLECEARPSDDLVSGIETLGLPFGDSSLLPAMWVSRAARRCVAVALGGDGGDELFGGYERYRWASAAAAWLPGGAALGRVLSWRAGPRSRRAKAARLFAARAGDGYYDLMSIFPIGMLEKLFSEHLAASPEVQWHLNSEVADASEAIEADMRWYLPFDLLCKSDAASMSCALELRSPFLDRRLVIAATRARIEDLMPGGERKGLLRAVARSYFPASIVDRSKMGFAIPIGEWFRTDSGGMRTLLMDHMDSAEPWGSPSLGIALNTTFVRKLIDEHMNGRRDHSQRLYMLLVLSIWAKRVSRV